jgi:hypothetical protein
MVRLTRAIALFLCALAPVGGCSSGTETGNPSFQAELAYTAYSSAPSLVGVRDRTATVVVDSAWLDLDAVALLRAGTCGGSATDALLVPALGIGDHAAGNHNLTRFELASGSFCAVELPFVRAPERAVSGEVPTELAQHSIMLAGSLDNGTRFSLLSAATPVVRLVADAGTFEISTNRARTLITFDVATWLEDLDWSGATERDGTVFVSATENASLLARFEAKLARGVALYLDRDGDGKLDAAPERLAHGE